MSEVKDIQEHEILKGRPCPLEEVPLVLNNRSLKWVTDKICGIVESKTPRVVVVVLYHRTLYC